MNEALWALGRGTGVVALVMFTLALVLGILSRSGRSVGGLGRFGINELHRVTALTGTALLGVHVGTLLVDPYAQLRLVDLLVPFLGAARPVWLGLGTLAADVLLVVAVVSLLRHRVGPRLFRWVHGGTYLLWPLSVAHTLGNGTDRQTVWLLALTGTCVTAVLVSLAWRLSPGFAERGFTARIPRRAVS